jgi:hypothetical protein
VTVISDATTIEEIAALVSEALSRAGITAVLSGGGAVQEGRLTEFREFARALEQI